MVLMVPMMLIIGSLAAPGSGIANSERDETERWVPSVSVFGGFIGQRADGAVESSDYFGPAYPQIPPPQPIQPAASGDDTLTSAIVGGSIELMTPRLVDKAGRPRIFAHIDLGAAFGFERTVAGDGKPGEFEEPPRSGNQRIAENTIAGQGSRTLADTQTFLVSAGAGVAFTLDWGHRRIRIKPSIEYLREQLQISGIVNRAIRLDRPSNLWPESFRFISLSDSTTETYHGLGPGIEIEADAVRAGPFMTSVFVSGQGYYFFGDRDIELRDENEYGEYATWNFEKQDWGWGMRFGIRFRWLPE